jgi:hypothetical protein
MRSNTVRVVLGIAVVAVAVVLLIVLKDDSDDKGSGGGTTTTEQANSGSSAQTGKSAIPNIAVKNGKPVGGIAELTYSEGEQVRFRVDSDISEEIHVHGYDIAKDVEAGGSVLFDFPATIEGLFEVELEHLGQQIAELRVNP